MFSYRAALLMMLAAAAICAMPHAVAGEPVALVKASCGSGVAHWVERVTAGRVVRSWCFVTKGK